MNLRTLSWRGFPFKPISGRRALTTIINSQYSMVVSAIIGIASATYFWIIGPKNLVTLVGVSVTFIASASNIIYLVLHQILSFRYLKPTTSICLCRKHDETLVNICMAMSGVTIIAWTTASILGLIAASKAPFCVADTPGTLEWKTISGCRLQRASVAGSLLNILNSCMLVYAIRTSDRPFAASLRGIKLRGTVEEEVLVSRRFSVSTTNSPNEKQFSLGSCSPRSACSPVTPTPAPRERRCWLPPLEVIPETNHPTLQSRLDRIAWEHSHENLHTPIIHPVPPLPAHTSTTDCQTPSQKPTIKTPTRDSHSISSPPNSDSIYSRKSSGLSYHGASKSLPSKYSHTTLDTRSSDPVYSRDSSTQNTSHLPSFSRSTYGSTKSYSINSRRPSTRSSRNGISHSVSLPSIDNSFSPPNKNSFSPSSPFSPINNNSFSTSNNNSFSPSNPIPTTTYLPETHTASSPNSKQPASRSRPQSRSTNSDIISHYAYTISTHDGSSPDSAILSSPPPSPKNEPTPDLPPIPERYLHKISPSTHPISRNQPQRPDSSPSMPPAKFWPYARAQQRRYNASAQTSPQKRLDRILSQETLQDLPHTPSKSPKQAKSKLKSPDRSLILRGDAVLLATPGRAVLRMNMNKGNIAVVSKEGSWEQLRRGKNGRGIWGKEMDWEMLLGNLRGEQVGEGKENDSRALVRVRKEWEDKMRVIEEESKTKVELRGTEVPPTPPKWQFGWI